MKTPVIVLAMAAAFMLMESALNAAEQPSVNQLQRLFTTPYERAQLDAMRRRGTRVDEPPEAQTQAAALPPLQVEVKGLVVRKNAPNVVWVNKSNTIESKTINERIKARPERAASDSRVPIVVNGKQVRMKPGQVWDEIDDSVSDTYTLKRSSVADDVVEKLEELAGDTEQAEEP